MSTSGTGLEGGELNRALANELGKLVAAFTGRGATKSRAFVHHDIAVCLLEDGVSRAEENLIVAGKADLVRLGRDAIQRAMEPQLVASVERLTGRRVATFLSGTSTPGSDSVEVFVLEPLPDAGSRREVVLPA